MTPQTRWAVMPKATPFLASDRWAAETGVSMADIGGALAEPCRFSHPARKHGSHAAGARVTGLYQQLSLRSRRRGGWRAERATGVVPPQASSLKQLFAKLFEPIVEHFPDGRPHPSALRASTLPALRAAEGDFAACEGRLGRRHLFAQKLEDDR